ncbi:hypothetical protein NPIL_542151 [Nephila pilipes]|uniref:Uncharacterized protein n=1 Tax=Nephila pilipes TaxID=299642 RepID=A0A8X6UJL6_NEPPI|nr:hypothetical protein NPIL_542151 [Nephila pilipes]
MQPSQSEQETPLHAWGACHNGEPIRSSRHKNRQQLEKPVCILKWVATYPRVCFDSLVLALKHIPLEAANINSSFKLHSLAIFQLQITEASCFCSLGMECCCRVSSLPDANQEKVLDSKCATFDSRKDVLQMSSRTF